MNRARRTVRMLSDKNVRIAFMRALRFLGLAGTLTGSVVAAVYLWQPLIQGQPATTRLSEPALQPAGQAAAERPITVTVAPPRPAAKPKPQKPPVVRRAARPHETIAIAPAVPVGAALVPGLSAVTSHPSLPKSTPIVVQPLKPAKAQAQLPKLVPVVPAKPHATTSKLHAAAPKPHSSPRPSKPAETSPASPPASTSPVVTTPPPTNRIPAAAKPGSGDQGTQTTPVTPAPQTPTTPVQPPATSTTTTTTTTPQQPLPPPTTTTTPTPPPPATGGTLLVTSIQAMEGDLKVAQGSILRAGFDMTMPGGHPTAAVVFLGTSITFAATCASGTPGTATIVVAIGSQSYVDPTSDSGWYASGDQQDGSTYQGSAVVPSFCDAGALVRLQQGGFLSTSVASSDTQDPVHVRWHYNCGGAGGWSGTYSVIPS